ncbi:hypothetical protein J437_LFUL006661 [Ladona fulva]|uniref:Uncharacterized protein n=1 Tax=Ladona fulva TaxID=123851 RepID=A0A8K0P153_LADFU|nr:hypothetical protein J437_LFUL006661 [Ladona fulva]
MRVIKKVGTTLLTDDHRQRRMGAAESFLQLVEREGDALFSQIVTGDATWVHEVDCWARNLAVEWYDTGLKKFLPSAWKLTFLISLIDLEKAMMVTQPPFNDFVAQAI